jgi:hypothetical protein
VRVELRALPSGPTVTDMLANAAFLVGLTLALTEQAPRLTRQLSFARANANFYRAARHGPSAQLEWPGADGPQRGDQLAAGLLPAAAAALEAAGVDGEEVGLLLGVVEARIRSGRTGAAWQRATLLRLEPELGRDGALRALLERYLELSATGEPVHAWEQPGV